MNFNKKEMAGLRAAFQKRMIITDCLQSCIGCFHFNAANENCNLNNMRPPARIIAVGCECYEPDICEKDIPF